MTSSARARETLPAFSHLYVEAAVRHHPRTLRILERFPEATVVAIDHLGELTKRRSGAAWSHQKAVPKLVLAQKTDPLIYPCSDVAPNFGHPHFYYAVPMQNCLYDCQYCYLQGMYSTAHLVVFVNQEEIQQAVRDRTTELGELYLCIAYDNDLLAMEGKLGLVGEWIEALRSSPRTTVEVRTKSANFASLRRIPPSPNVILAWTLSPPEVIARYEAGTPPLAARLAAAGAALEAGWRVRFCLDPLIPVQNWASVYQDFLQTLDQSDLWARLDDASYGSFRMNGDYLRQARKVRPESPLLQGATAREERGLFTLAHPDGAALQNMVGQALMARLGAERVFET